MEIYKNCLYGNCIVQGNELKTYVSLYLSSGTTINYSESTVSKLHFSTTKKRRVAPSTYLAGHPNDSGGSLSMST